ncbi:MAG: hypothetical protein WKG00_23085 [Polyangiaceae bacterium]
MRRLVGGLALAAALSACAGEAPPAPARPTAPGPGARQAEFSDRAWASYRSRRFGLVLPLPEASAWRIDDRGTQWLEASHAATGSELSVRMWHEDEIVNRDRCEARARGWKKLPPSEEIEVLLHERVPVPPEFDTALSVGLVAPAPGRPLVGTALAFGGWAHGCFAFLYRTSATGAGAEEAVGSRLAAIVDGSLRKLQRQSDRSPAIPRAPAP